MIEEIKVPKIRIKSKKIAHNKKSVEIVSELMIKRAERRSNRWIIPRIKSTRLSTSMITSIKKRFFLNPDFGKTKSSSTRKVTLTTLWLRLKS